MELNKEIRCKDKDVNDYIDALENWITNLRANKFYELVMACDDASGKIAEDIRVLSNTSIPDEEVDGKLLMLGSSGNKRYERFLATVKQLKDFKLIDDLLQESKPKKAEKSVKTGRQPKEVVVEEIVQPPRMQDFVMNKNGNK